MKHIYKASTACHEIISEGAVSKGVQNLAYPTIKLALFQGNFELRLNAHKDGFDVLFRQVNERQTLVNQLTEDCAEKEKEVDGMKVPS